MAKLISDVDDAIEYLNTLYEGDSDAPSSDEDDYSIWLSLFNLAIDLWENEEGILWKELFVKLADAADGDKTTAASDTSYTVPTDFKFPASGYVWLGTGTNKTAYKVIKQEDIVLYENDSSNWCYFLMDTTPTLEFNPNLTIKADLTINYNYYKHATKLTTGTDTFELSDPMFVVYYALSELNKEEGDSTALTIATQKLDAMKTRNVLPAWIQSDSLLTTSVGDGFGL